MKKTIQILALFFISTYLFGSSFKTVGIGGGGAFYSPSINPFNPKEIYISSDMSNLFRTTNAGDSWDMYHYDVFRGLMQSKIAFTSDAKIMYSVRNELGADLFILVKSTDGGITWNKLPSDPTQGDVLNLFADDNSTNRLIISSYDYIYFSSNGGASFKQIYEADLFGNGAYIAGVHWDGTKIIICLSDGFLESNDNGNTFNKVVFDGFESEEYPMQFVSAKVGATTRFYVVTVDDVWPGIQGWDNPQFMGFYTMDYNGTNYTWTSKTNAISANFNPYFVAIAKNNLNTVYLAGNNSQTNTPLVLKSTNSGTNFTEIFQTSNNKNIVTGWQGYQGDKDWTWGEKALGFACASNNPNYLAITDYGFIHISTNGGSTWEQKYVSKNNNNTLNNPTPKGKTYQSNGLENTTCWWLSLNEEGDNSTIFAAFTDISGIISTDNGNSWSFNYKGHTDNTMYHIIKVNVNSTQYLLGATSSIHDLYQSTYLQDIKIDYGKGKVLYSSDGGKNWNLIKDFGMPVVFLAANPNNQNQVYASVVNSTNGGIYYCSDISKGPNSQWTKLSDPPRTQGHPYNIYVLNDNSILCTYSGRRDAQGVFTASSGVFISSDNGQSWNDISHNNMKYWTKDIIIDKNDKAQNTFYCSVFSGWGGAANGLGGLYKTTDRGKSWVKIFDSDRVESVAQHPILKDRMYLTTEFEGLWVTNNLYSTNPKFEQVSDYPFQHPLRVFFTKKEEISKNTVNTDMWVTSFGAGIKILENEYSQTINNIEEFETEQLSIFPNPASNYLKINNSYNNKNITKIEIFNSFGNIIFEDNSILNFGEYKTINLEGINSNQIIFIKLFTNENIYFKKIIINK